MMVTSAWWIQSACCWSSLPGGKDLPGVGHLCLVFVTSAWWQRFACCWSPLPGGNGLPGVGHLCQVAVTLPGGGHPCLVAKVCLALLTSAKWQRSAWHYSPLPGGKGLHGIANLCQVAKVCRVFALEGTNPLCIVRPLTSVIPS